MSPQASDSRTSNARFLQDQEPQHNERVHFATDGDARAPSKEQSLTSRKPPSSLMYFPTPDPMWLIIPLFAIFVFNAWYFWESLSDPFRGNPDGQRTSQSRIVSLPSIALSSFRSKSFASDCQSCDTLSPAMKRAITEYVQVLLSRAGVQSAETATVGLRRDYALKADGASIVCDLTSGCTWWLANVPGFASTASYAIDDSHAIGHCWYLAASSGQLGILLAEPVYPLSVTVDHIPHALAADIGQAPRNMIVWGLLDGEQNKARFHQLSFENEALLQGRSGPSTAGGHPFAPLAAFEYDTSSGLHVQSFPVFRAVVEARIDFAIVIMEILDNWGGKVTCLYRLRVHGESAGW